MVVSYIQNVRQLCGDSTPSLSMRLFFALQPDPDLALEIDVWRQRHIRLDARAVPPQNLHVTLYFCGECDSDQTRQLISRAQRIDAQRLTLPLDTFGYFGNSGIAWIGPDRPHDGLNDLHRQLAPRAERRFTPHLTLFRGVNEPPPPPLLPPDFSLRCDAFALMVSQRGEKGVRYDTVEVFPLHR